MEWTGTSVMNDSSALSQWMLLIDVGAAGWVDKFLDSWLELVGGKKQFYLITRSTFGQYKL
jgi:hypothetical protein